ncbi:hypothetical protein TNCT_238591, partial [Trichonephila clavata]
IYSVSLTRKDSFEFYFERVVYLENLILHFLQPLLLLLRHRSCMPFCCNETSGNIFIKNLLIAAGNCFWFYSKNVTLISINSF